MKSLYTTNGLLTLDGIKYFLPHEHIVLDLSQLKPTENTNIDMDSAIKIIVPFLISAKEKGISVLGECSPIGTGRNIEIMQKASAIAKLPIIVSTGMYCDPWIPYWVKDKNVAQIADIFIKELTEGTDNTNVKAGFIKVGVFKDKPTDNEIKVMEAACCASKETGCAILAHAMNWASAEEHIKILKKYNCGFEKYIWAHAHREENLDNQCKALDLGCYVEYDGIGNHDKDDSLVMDLVLKMKEKGFGAQVLLSQDRGWYNPSKANGGEFKPYTYMTDVFINKMKDNNIDDEYINMLLKINPFNAMARDCIDEKYGE